MIESVDKCMTPSLAFSVLFGYAGPGRQAAYLVRYVRYSHLSPGLRFAGAVSLTVYHHFLKTEVSFPVCRGGNPSILARGAMMPWDDMT